MTRLPRKVTYRFYGCGIPKSRAIRFMTIADMKARFSHVENKNAIMRISCHRQQHPGILLLRFLGWLHEFCDAKQAWFDWTEEATGN